MGEEKAAFVAATVCELAAKDFDKVSQEVAALAQRYAPTAPGMIEAAVLGGEGKTRLLVLTQWESRDAWARAEWDDEVGRVVADLAESGKYFDVRTFLPVAIVRSAR